MFGMYEFDNSSFKHLFKVIFCQMYHILVIMNIYPTHIHIYTYIYIYGLNTHREQCIVNIILYREHKMKTIINTIITGHIRAARYIA